MKLKSKLSTTGTSKSITIPSAIIKELELKVGDELLLDIINNKIIIEKKV